jgi:transcriptional regulator with XRE-family HTH domain
MSASSSSLEFGKRLRAEREHLRLSLRQVQELSRGIAEQRKNHEYHIAHSSLADIENGKLATNIYKLYSLSVIYGRQYEKLAAFFDVPVGEAEKDHKALVFPQTYLVGVASELGDSSILSTLETQGAVADRANQPRVEDSRKLERYSSRLVAADGLARFPLRIHRDAGSHAGPDYSSWIFCANRFPAENSSPSELARRA